MKTLSLLLILITTSTFASNDVLTQLINRRESIKLWAPECEDGSYSEYTDHCNQHDVTLFAGMACLGATLAGDTITADKRCSDVEKAQGANGRWWRGPIRVEDGLDNSFSRDMARGVHAYIIARGYLATDESQKLKVKEQAQNWLKWINTDEADNNLCTEYTRNRCNITIGARNLFYYSFNSVGALEGLNFKMAKKIKRSKWYLNNIFLPETKLSQTGFPRHLKSASALMYRVLNMKAKDKKVKKVTDKASEFLYKKDRENALLDFMANGVTDGSVNKLLTRCPVNIPGAHNPKRDFQWQRTTNPETSAVSDGHDCIYLINLMVAKINGNLTW